MFVAHNIAIAQDVFSQENYCSDVARGCEPKEMAADGNPALGFRTIHCFRELLVLAPPLQCAAADAQKGGSLLISTLQSIKLFKFNKIDVRFRPCHQLPPEKNPQFRTPVR
jgi:hypothetical protein